MVGSGCRLTILHNTIDNSLNKSPSSSFALLLMVASTFKKVLQHQNVKMFIKHKTSFKSFSIRRPGNPL